jgi:oligosaccharide repeat unit polymerase
MNISITIITLIILIIGAFVQLKVWGARSLLSPGFYFSIIWSLGVFGLLVFKSLDLVLEPYPEYIDELNILVAYTSLCFTIFVKIGRKKIKCDAIIKLNFLSSFNLFKGISFFYLIIAVYVFITEGSGFDFGKARDSMHATIENRSIIIGYFRMLSLPLAIYAGSKLVEILSKKGSSSIIKYVILLLPFIADTLFSFTEGGRVAMVYTMLMYVIGGAISLPINFNYRRYKKIIINALAFVLLINVLISWVATTRADSDKNSAKVALIKDELGLFSFLYGAIEYVQTSYLGYQYRRVDAVDTKELGYGVYTFNGFINWQLPFTSRFGIKNTSIAHIFNVYYHNQETYDFDRDFYYVTHSAYIPIIKDFGFKGAFIALMLMVYLSHSLFVRIQDRRKITFATTFFLYYLFLYYWASSNFYGTLSNSILIPLYSLVIIDIVNFFTKRSSWSH